MHENKTIMIYFENGKTASFEQVTDIDVNENNTLTFNHTDVHSKVKHFASFNFNVIAGFSTTDA